MQLLTSDRIFSAVNYRIKWHRLYVSTFVYFQRALNSLNIRCLSYSQRIASKRWRYMALNLFELKMKFNMAMVIREYKIFNMISQTTRLNRAITDSYSIITRRRKQMRNVIIAKHFFLFLIKNTFLPTDRFRIKDYLLSFPPFSPSSLLSFSHPSLRFLPSSSSMFLYLSELENTLRINKRQTRFTLTRLVTGRVWKELNKRKQTVRGSISVIDSTQYR